MSKLKFGSLRILGAVIIIIGLYLVLWGKDRDPRNFKSQEQPEETQNTNGIFNRKTGPPDGL